MLLKSLQACGLLPGLLNNAALAKPCARSGLINSAKTALRFSKQVHAPGNILPHTRNAKNSHRR